MNWPSSKRVSVSDVARSAGVSTQTVSRVVNNAASVAPATRERVAAAIQALGYQRSELARSLNQGRTRTLGIVLAGYGIRHDVRLNGGLTTEAEQQGYSLVLSAGRNQAESGPDDWAQALLARQVDGILWVVPQAAENEQPVLNDIMHRHGVPIVGLATPPGRNFPVVCFDNYVAGLMATQHLISRGRRCIAHISGPEASWDARGRTKGWRDALHAADLPAASAQVCAGTWSPESGDRALRQLLLQCPQLDAVFCANDSMALGVLHAAHELGLCVPDDFALVGVDDIPQAAYYTPALTTVRQNHSDLGRSAVRMLAALADARFGEGPMALSLSAPSDFLQAPELIVRKSS